MIIWLASYPKSGNTWLRSLLASYYFSKDGDFNFNLLRNIDKFPSYNHFKNYNKFFFEPTDTTEFWLEEQKKINSDNKIKLFKTHNALCTINGNQFTDKFNTNAVIYIVRDPRNLITSLSHHYEINLKDAYKFLTNTKKIIFPNSFSSKKKIKKTYRDVNVLGDWSGHYQSWKNIGFCPIKIVKYEDILLDTRNTFISILEFISKFVKLKIENEKISQSLNSTNFNILSEMEEKKGFIESAISSKTKKNLKFFNLGKDNNWKKLLDYGTAKKIENIFKKEMKELDYL